MASPRHSHFPARSGNKENISEDGGPIVLDYPASRKDGPSSPPRPKKKHASFNLRKSVAWNPAFFTEQGVLDNLELSVLTGSQLLANGSPSSGVPFCHSGSACVLKEVAENSCQKLPAKYCSAEKQGRKLFSSERTPQSQRRESAGAHNRSSARKTQKCIAPVPPGSIQRKVPNSSSTAQISRIHKRSQASVPTFPRNIDVLKSNIKLGPVSVRVPGLPPKSKVNSVSSGSSTVKDVVSAICEGASGSVKGKIFLPRPQITPSSAFHGPTSTFSKPSGLRMPSPSVGFFTQENAHVSHGDATKRNEGRCFMENTSVVKPPRYKQTEDLKSRHHLTKPLSTKCTAASNLLVLPVTRESNSNNLVGSEKGTSSKVISDVNNKKKPDVDCLLSGSGTTIQPVNSENNAAARNSMPIVYNDTSRVERRPITEEIEPIENPYPHKSSTIEPAEDSFSLKSTCSAKPILGGTLSPSCISSQVCSDLTCQSKSESHSTAAIGLEYSDVGEDTSAISLSEGDNNTLSFDFLRGSDSCDHQNTEYATLVSSTVCAEQVPCGDSSKDETPPYLARSNSDFNSSLCNEEETNNGASSEETVTDGGMELETNNALLAVKEVEIPLLDGCGHNHIYRSTQCSPTKPEVHTPCVERWHVLSVEPNTEDKMVLDTDKLSAPEGASHIEKNNALDRSRTNTIHRDHLKNLVPFTEEWLAVMEARGQEVLEQKTGAVQNSPTEKTAPEPSPWSPVKRKAQDVGPFDCTKYSKSVGTSDTP